MPHSGHAPDAQGLPPDPTAGRLRLRGELSEAYPADAIDRERIGLPMAGAHEAGAAAP